MKKPSTKELLYGDEEPKKKKTKEKKEKLPKAEKPPKEKKAKKEKKQQKKAAEIVEESPIEEVIVSAENTLSENDKPITFNIEEHHDLQPEAELPEPASKKEKKPKKINRRQSSSFFRSKAFVGMICLIAAVLIAFAVIPTAQIKINDTVTVLEFSKNVSATSVISEDMVKEVQMSKYNIPSDALSSKSDIIGKYVKTDAIKGDVITSSRVSQTYPGDDPALASLPEGKYAVSINLNDIAASVSSKLRAGDVIQIYAAFEDNLNNVDYYAQVPQELQYVEILAVTDAAASDVENKDSGSSKAISSSSSSSIQAITVIVNQQQASAIIGLEYSATLHAALVCRGDDEVKSSILAKQEEVLLNIAKEG